MFHIGGSFQLDINIQCTSQQLKGCSVEYSLRKLDQQGFRLYFTSRLCEYSLFLLSLEIHKLNCLIVLTHILQYQMADLKLDIKMKGKVFRFHQGSDDWGFEETASFSH
jgi:hypothetical protein